MTAADGALPPISDDSWFDMLLTDETGYAFEPESFVMPDDQTLLFTFAGAKDKWELMKKADLLLCEAKRAGRARVWTDK